MCPVGSVLEWWAVGARNASQGRRWWLFRRSPRVRSPLGGVLEHPEASHAWAAFGLAAPPRYGGWIPADVDGGWTCCVEQGHYGHKARKATWLYAHSVLLPSLACGKAEGKMKIDLGFHSTEERRRAVRRGVCERQSHSQRAATPLPFRDILLDMARTVQPR